MYRTIGGARWFRDGNGWYRPGYYIERVRVAEGRRWALYQNMDGWRLLAHYRLLRYAVLAAGAGPGAPWIGRAV